MKILKLFPVFILCSTLLSCTIEPLSVESDPLYETVPNISNCEAGTLSQAEKQKILTYINSVREIHNLPAVEYNTTSTRNELAQKAALIVAANASISGTVLESDFCYSANVAKEYANVNRSLWENDSPKWPSSETHVNDWMTELNSDNIDCRRRILDPFLKSVAFGRIIGTPRKGNYKHISSATLLTDYGNVDLSEKQISYIAYPQGNYNAKLFDPNSFLSFSVLCDKSTKSNNGALSVNFSEATIEVSVGTQKLDLVEGSRSYNYNNVGLPNNLQWKVQGLAKNAFYTVKIQGVIVMGEIKDYEYTFSFK
jgi:hypothetical protein